MTVATRPDHVPPALVRDFDFHRDPQFRTDPFRAFERVRGDRIFWTPADGGYWVLTRSADIRAVLRNTELFSSDRVSISATPVWPRRMIPAELDPPEHGRYRRLLLPLFSPNAVAGMDSRIRHECVRLIDRFRANGSCELLTDLAEPLQNKVFLDIVGLPQDQADLFRKWKRGLMQAADRERRKAAGADLIAFFEEQLDARETAPQPTRRDVIAVLLESRVDERPLTRDEVLDTLILLFMAGLDTLVTVAGFSFRFLAEHPEHRRQLAASPALAPQAAEELLRVHSIASVSRTATRDTELCGVRIRRGDRILAATSLANRDPREFDAATEVRFDRPANRHIAYGAGPHRCIGSHLASRELAIILEEFHRRIPEYGLPDGYRVRTGGGALASIEAVPLVWRVA